MLLSGYQALLTLYYEDTIRLYFVVSFHLYLAVRESSTLVGI